MSRGWIIAFLLLLPCIAHASEKNQHCRWLDSKGPFGLAIVTGRPEEPIALQDTFDAGTPIKCPNHDPSTCPMKRYLVPGDQVITSYQQDDFTCIWYRSPKGKVSSGWVPTRNLQTASPAKPQWIGTWSNGHLEIITISANTNGMLEVAGDTKWIGAVINKKTGERVVHMGGINAEGKPERNHLHLVNDSCILDAWLLEPYLIAVDNSMCGGINARFNGIYTRRKDFRE